MSAARLQQWFPWVRSPVVCNGPMLGAACPALAAEVTKAGGIGFLASVFDLGRGSPQLAQLDADLTAARALLGPGAGPLRVGVSFITGHATVGHFAETALPVVATHAPAAVWLFAPAGGATHRPIIAALKSLDPAPRVAVQVGNVAAAREAVADGADVVVCQGIDAGGHQFRRGAGVVALVPEVRRMLADEFAGRPVALLAAGGIVDAKGVAAMMALEADGVVMGTRFTVAQESVYPDYRKQLILQTADGASTTLKSPFNDQINNSSLWGPLYDGRAIVGPIHDKFLAGASVDECQKSLKEDYPPDEAAKMVNTWACVVSPCILRVHAHAAQGTAVGLVEKPQPAGEIVAEVREGAREHIRKLAQLLE